MVIIEKLQQYKANKARIAVLDVQIKQIYEHISALKGEPVEEQIEGKLFYVPLSDPVQGGNMSDPTALIAFSDNHVEIREAHERIDVLQRERTGLQYLVDEIDAALSVLSEQELFVIEQYYIQDFSWQQVLIHWMNRKGEDMSESWAKRQRAAGVDKMERTIKPA